MNFYRFIYLDKYLGYNAIEKCRFLGIIIRASEHLIFSLLLNNMMSLT